jgi:Putative Actinobacterial Holin-X, holin superfamily III
VSPRHATPDGDTASTLFGDVVVGIARLVKGEFALMRAEAQRSLQNATGAIVTLAVAAALAIVAFNLLATAAVTGLVAAGLASHLAGMAVGGALLIAALVVFRRAMARLAPASLMPERSFANLRQDAEILKSMVSPHATSDLRP